VAELDELLRRVIEDRLLDLHTSLPGEVVSYDSDNQTADVRPMVKRPVPTADGGFAYEQIPTISGVLVLSYGTARSCLQVPLEPGDFVWLLFPESSAAEFFGSGRVSQPGLVERHGLSTPLAIPFTLPGHGGTTDVVALAGKIDLLLQTFWTWANAHTHLCTAPATPSATALPVLDPPTPTGAEELGAK
jgi:hypothetical protein